MGLWQRFELALALRPYAQALWKERQRFELEGNAWLSHVCKSLMARLHGKFLQRSSRWEHSPGVPVPGAWQRWYRFSQETGELLRFRSIGWEPQCMVPAGDAPHCFPAIAAWVTATGREWLRSWMSFAGPQNVLYCSTDSLIVTDDGRANLENRGIISNDGIGSLRVVASTDTIDIRGVNNLSFGERETVSGLPEGSVSLGGDKWLCRHRSTMGVAQFCDPPAGLGTRTFLQTLPVSRLDGTIGQEGWIVPPHVTPSSLKELEQQWESQSSAQPALAAAGCITDDVSFPFNA
jgi:hypothetical protein